MLLLNTIQVLCLLLTACSPVVSPDQSGGFPFAHASNTVRIPMGGNSWVVKAAGGTETISQDGLINWSSPASTIDTYVRFEKAGTLNLSASGQVPTGKSRIRVTLLGESKEIDIEGNRLTDHPLGQWTVAKAGYVKITLQGISKTGNTFADVVDFSISGEAVDERIEFVKTNEGNFFYWGRRGPSVHLRYPLPDGVEAEWFYNEVTVPTGSDVIGSYYMANGFGEGYFGMQVNSVAERRVLFSVWSPFQTDDPSKIPDDQKIRLERKGADVVTNDFGNEGSGGQSYLRYNWVVGQTYQFLLRGRPATDGYTTYTAYFKPADRNNWQLIASFSRPKTSTYLKSLYSFLENFVPQTGNVTREVEFSNQWIKSRDGAWRELTNAQFTGDATAQKTYRMDYAGGLSGNQRFFLRNCGFFNAYTPLKSTFTRPAQGLAPTINVAALP